MDKLVILCHLIIIHFDFSAETKISRVTTVQECYDKIYAAKPLLGASNGWYQLVKPEEVKSYIKEK